jgi:uncharacterized membrane protein
MLPVETVFTLWGVAALLTRFPGRAQDVAAVLLIMSVWPAAIGIKRDLLGYPDKVKPSWLNVEDGQTPNNE